MKKQFNLNKFLETAEKETSSCIYCKDPTLRETLEAFMEKKAAGETHISLNYLYDNCLVPTFGVPKNQRNLYRHVKICMKRDIKTGKPLNDKT